MSPKSAAFERWFDGSTITDAVGSPLVMYHGTRTPETLTEFVPGGPAHAERTGDAYGVAAYFTSSPSEASFHARDTGAVIPVFLRGEILDLDAEIPAAQAERLSELAKTLLLPSDRARFECGRATRTFDDVQDARDFFEAQRKNWEAFGDGMDRARPEAVASEEKFQVLYTDFDAPVPIRTGAEAATLFNAVGWENLAAAGFDGVKMVRDGGSLWVAMHRTAGTIKSACGNSGAFNSADSDITDRRAMAAKDFLTSLAGKKAALHA